MTYAEFHFEGGSRLDVDDESDVYLEDPETAVGDVVVVDPDRWGR